jgi:protein-S-isoprenylcysteine O-methyltransferase Ste14
LLIGLLLQVAGLGLYLWGARVLGEMYRAASAFGVRLHQRQRLITHGPFALVRHPLYLGLQLAALGGLCLHRTWAMAFVSVNFLGLVLRARREEQALAEAFGAEWEAYCRDVPAWLPGRLPPRTC